MRFSAISRRAFSIRARRSSSVIGTMPSVIGFSARIDGGDSVRPPRVFDPLVAACGGAGGETGGGGVFEESAAVGLHKLLSPLRVVAGPVVRHPEIVRLSLPRKYRGHAARRRLCTRRIHEAECVPNRLRMSRR